MVTKGAPVPASESRRLEELESYSVLDSEAEQAYDDLAYLASHICGTPIALVSLVDRDRQWFKSRIGLDVHDTPRELAFCAHAILKPTELMEVRDASGDERFADNPLVVSDPNIRFYAGAPLTTSAGNALGTLCVIDRKPRELTPEQRRALLALSRQVMSQLELRQTVVERRRYARRLEEYQRQLESAIARVYEESVSDDLTGLRNRRFLFERLEEEVGRSLRHGTPLSFALLDIDRFKAYNDDFGHPAGDASLRLVAQLIATSCRQHDIVARYGGEEFAVILPSTDREGGSIVVERCRRSVERAEWEHRPMTISAGVAALTATHANVDALVKAADDALYAAKQQGRNRVVAADSP